MKRIAFIVIFSLVLSLPLSAHTDADGADALFDYCFNVRGTELDTGNLPFAAYAVGEDESTLMVPLRIISESLGYIVTWDETSATITVDAGIQTLYLTPDTMSASFVGMLDGTDISRIVELPFPATIHDGHTYVPLMLFEYFFVSIFRNDSSVTIFPLLSDLY
ncbi:MAG: copper amine oxidase N-terminal domain-containing protein [Clostridia bacterium]|nr:copper amine oxidase N-terminal domain-containing protein [Clostridia bacterium]